MTVKKPISALLLPPEHPLLANSPTPNVEVHNPPQFLGTLKEKLLVQRRSHAVSSQNHFSVASPVPVPIAATGSPPTRWDSDLTFSDFGFLV